MKPKRVSGPLLKKARQTSTWVDIYKTQIANRKASLAKKYGTAFIKTLKIREVNGKKVLLGEGYRGKVYLGDLKFQDGKSKRVAIKVFRFNKEYGASDVIRKYKEIIHDLENIKIPKGLLGNEREIPLIPKCAIVQLDNGDYVFVSQAFTRLGMGGQESKFVKRSELPALQDLNFNKQLVYTGAILTSFGYVVNNDIYMRFKGKKDFVLLDLDGPASNEKFKPEHRASAFVNEVLRNNIDRIKNSEKKKELLEFTRKFIREDKGNLDSDFKRDVWDILNKIKI